MAKRKSTESPAESPVSFEESLGELQSIVSELEDGALGLETSLARFERGIGLLRTCYQILEAAEAKVEILTRFQAEGAAVTAPFGTAASFDIARERDLNQGRSDAPGNPDDDPDAISEDSSNATLF